MRTGLTSLVRQVPPALNRFTKAVDKNMAGVVAKLMQKYKPEDKAEKKARLLKEVRPLLPWVQDDFECNGYGRG